MKKKYCVNRIYHIMNRLLYILCACAWGLCATAGDLTQRLGAQVYAPDTTETATLDVALDALAFFKDNEFDGDVVTGYSLPGMRLQPRLVYTPMREIRLEAGLHATVYEGANKYPAYAFHDIAHWKGNQYQRGAHVLPFFRTTAHLGATRRTATTIVLGDIYGGATHQLALPLYNPELVLTDDPEMGLQIIADRRCWHSDVWLNWQSYIFEEDTHQEAFTVGWTQRICLTRQRAPEGHKAAQAPRWGRLSMPLQIIAQHRGGEQDVAALGLGVQTVGNAGVGLDYEWTPSRASALTAVRAEAYGLFALQQKGALWPFDFGGALWSRASLEFLHDLQATIGVFHAPRQFCSLYGSPFFGTMSVKHVGTAFDGATSAYWSLEYGKTFSTATKCTRSATNDTRSEHDSVGPEAKKRRAWHSGVFTIGAKVDGYVTRSRTPFSFGVYFRACPRFHVKK